MAVVCAATLIPCWTPQRWAYAARSRMPNNSRRRPRQGQVPPSLLQGNVYLPGELRRWLIVAPPVTSMCAAMVGGGACTDQMEEYWQRNSCSAMVSGAVAMAWVPKARSTTYRLDIQSYCNSPDDIQPNFPAISEYEYYFAFQRYLETSFLVNAGEKEVCWR